MSTTVSVKFQLVEEKGWRRGLRNLLQGEYSAWFKSSRWWKHLALWFSIINIMMIIMLIVSANAAKDGKEGPPVLFMYGIFSGMFVAIGVMIIMQRVLVGEKQAGTAAWVLTKPVTRTAFVVSRLIVNSIREEKATGSRLPNIAKITERDSHTRTPGRTMNAGKPIFDEATHYRIEVRGRVDVEWLQSFNGSAEVGADEASQLDDLTEINVLTDQAGIVGLVRRLHALGLTILRLQIIPDPARAGDIEGQG